jgi:manganese/iron transport system ATP-binding protein
MYPHTAHQPGEPILELRDVAVRYDGRSALEAISFHLHAGERVAVVGPNGAGKSTLLKTVAGVLTPNRGEVRVSGSGPGRHVCIAYVPQRSQVDWRFPVTVADVVMMGRIAKLGPLGWPRKADWGLVRGALETVDLVDQSGRQIGELSGGQQQRTFIARALAQEAELMLMDEPLTGLDAPSQAGLLELLGELQGRGVTLMVATHDLEQAAEHFERILLLNRRMIALGPPRQVLQPDLLTKTYGDRLRMVGGRPDLAALDEPCCEGDSHDGLA